MTDRRRGGSAPATEVLSPEVRTDPGQWLAECIAAFGLALTIFGCLTAAPAALAYAVGLYIVAA
jgi:hypothetical protein